MVVKNYLHIEALMSYQQCPVVALQKNGVLPVYLSPHLNCSALTTNLVHSFEAPYYPAKS
jgi:hypothetical protein